MVPSWSLNNASFAWLVRYLTGKGAEPEQLPRSLSSGDSRALLKLRPLRGTRGCRRRLRISAHREGVSHLCIIHSRSLRIAPSFDGGIVFACKSLLIFSHFIYFLFFTTFLTFQNSFKILLPSFYLKKKCFLYLKTTQSCIQSCQNLQQLNH